MASVTNTRLSLQPADGRRAPTAADSSIAEGADASVLALMDAVVAGDREAYGRLFLFRCEFVEREAIRRLSRRRDLAHDAAQDTWIRVARAPRRCESASKLDAWLQRIVASAVIDLLRSELSRRMREERIAESRPEAQRFVWDVELLEGVREELRGLDGLSSDERAMLELRTRTGATLTQLASILGIGRAAVDSRLRRACEIARKSIEGLTP